MTTWRKSSYSYTSGCVEFLLRPDGVSVRHSKDPDGPTVWFTPAAWRLLLAEVRMGRFRWSRLAPLQFTPAERVAFERGVLAGEVDLPKEVPA
jgi:hypothetical protein